MTTCAACHGPANGNAFWRGYVVCGECFANLTAEQLKQRIEPA